MVKSGANVKAIQRQLGHTSAAMTLDAYADLFDDDLDSVGGGESMNELLLQSAFKIGFAGCMICSKRWNPGPFGPG